MNLLFRWTCGKMCARKYLIFLAWVLFAVPTIEDTKTLKCQVGSNADWNWTFDNPTGDLISVTHNNKEILTISAEGNTSYNEPEWKDGMEVSFSRQGHEIQLTISLKNISKDNEGLYSAKRQLQDEDIYTVHVMVTGTSVPNTLGNIVSETTESPSLTNILLGTAAILPCLISVFLVYKLRKRCFKPNRNSSTTVEIVPPNDSLGTDRDFELVRREIVSAANYWTIEEDTTGGLHTVIDENGDLTSQSLGLTSIIPKNLQELPLQSDEDAYLHPI